MNQTAGMLREIIRLQEAFLDALEDMLDEIEGDVEDEEAYDAEGEDAEPQGIALLQGR
jgi:CRISPR/Cas system CSM-associated protein Csm2 small subunit